MSTWDDKPNDYEHALAEIARLRAQLAQQCGCLVCTEHRKRAAALAADGKIT